MTGQPAVPVVLHALRAYLPLTENWIHVQLRQARAFRPVVVCDTRVNAEAFPMAPVYALDDQPGAALLHTFNRLHRRLWYANWPGAYAAVLRACRPALIHAHFGDRGVLMAALAQQQRLPLITTFYGYDVSKLPREAKWRPRLAWLFERGDRFLAEGPYMRDALIALGCPPEKAFVQHLGIDLAGLTFAPRRPDDGPVRLLMAASFREKKGLRYGLLAFARVLARRPGAATLTIIGDGPLRDELHQLAEATGVAAHIRWLGYQPHEVFLAEARQAHLFLAPSVVAEDGDTEGGAPVTLLEVQATGLPVLATWHADIPEVTRPGQSACLVPERDVEALADRLDWLLDHPGRWPEMGEAGRRHVEAAFDAARLEAGVEHHYREVLEAQPKGRA